MEILEQPKKNIIMDATILSTIMSCARLTDFRFNYHFQAIGGKSVSLEMGSIVHTFCEHYYGKQIDGISRKDAIGFGMIAAKDYVNSDEVKNCSQEDIEIALDTCIQYAEFYRNDSWIPLEVEVVKGDVVYEDDEVRIMWKAKHDLIMDTNQGIRSVDHKTHKQRRDTLDLNNQFMGQCVLTKTRVMFVNKIGFQKSLRPEEKFSRVPINYSQDRLIEWQGTILPYWAKIMLSYDESGYWPPNFTHCENKYGFCQFRAVCSADRNMRQELIGQEFIVGKPWSI